MFVATKLGRIVTCYKGRPVRKSHDPLITWRCKTICQAENVPPPPQYLWPGELAG